MYYCVFAASACITVNCVVVDNTRGVIIDQLRATTDVVMEKLIILKIHQQEDKDSVSGGYLRNHR